MSEQYLVSARKYRPQTFDTVVGQEHITTTLKNAMRTGHLAHAFLFCGPRGVGKTTCARILARTLNCEKPTADMEACGTCNNCQAFNSNTSFNVFELDAASNNSVEDIRHLTEQVRFAPQQGKFKVYIIDEVHMLSTQAFNAFLKTLEEPPSYAIFILATTEKHKILPTILSRCQIFDFKRITTNDTVAHLQKIIANESIQADEASLHVIAQKSEGCMRDALSILDRIASFSNGNMKYETTMEHLNQLDATFYFSLGDFILSGDIASTLLKMDHVLERGFEGDALLNGLAEHYRNILLCKDVRMAKLLDIPAEHKPIYYEKAHQTPPSFVLSALHLINTCILEYKNVTNKRLHTELCLIRLCYLLEATNSSAVEEKKNTNPAQPISQPGFLEKTSAPGAPIATLPEKKQAISAQGDAYSPPPEKQIIRETQTGTYTSLPQMQPEPVEKKADSPASPQKPLISSWLNKNTDQGGTTRRISKHLIHQLSDNTVAEQKMDIKELTIEKMQEIFDEFKEKLRTENKSVLYAAFEAIKIEVPEEGTLLLISPNSITDSYAQSERSTLQDFIKAGTGLLIRIQNTFVETEEVPQERALSKNELFEQMAHKNNALLQLKEVLKLHIEY